MAKRRYRIGQYPEYDHTYNRARTQSQILNGGSIVKPGFDTILWDKNACLHLIYKYRGDSDGKYRDNYGERYLALIPAYEHELTEIQKQYHAYQESKINMGFKKPDEFPSDLLEKRLVTEASLDVAVEELIEVQKRLEKYKESERTRERELVLREGPTGNGVLRGGVLCEIAGQRCEMRGKVLMINEPESPYHGLAVSDYREYVSEPYYEAKNKIDSEIFDVKNRLLLSGCKDNRIIDAESDKRRNELMEQHPEWKRLFAIKWRSGHSIPAVPKDIKKYAP